ncbi:phage holin, LLH family [Desulfosporosinus sp. SB140]|uniref:phage holin, LLH family n=1 Tax=Desulfosporosinus paludis TaxID=3115649 RepID=UPI00388F18C1
MDVQSIISSGLSDIAMALVSALIALAGFYLKKHFTAKQLATAGSIASDAVNFATQAAKKHGIALDLGKYNAALGKAKELGTKAGIKMTDSQWEGLIESAYKQSKDQLAQLVGTATPYTQDEITNMIQNEVQKFKDEVQKAVPNVPVDVIADAVKEQIGKMNLTVNVATPAPAPASENTNPAQ